MQYTHIVCPVDGTEITNIGVEHAAYLAKMSGARLTLIHIVEKWYRSTHLVTDSAEWTKIHEEWLNNGRKLLEDLVKKLQAQGVKDIETVLREGDAAHEIVALAIEHKADLIVMATHRYTPVGKLFMGSVIDKVTKHSPCPILWTF
ncbi:MAG: universal stress protein [Deltaproteobacteria bacterium]|nr:universal stress protein [Deltaproteobacteria bacterium]